MASAGALVDDHAVRSRTSGLRAFRAVPRRRLGRSPSESCVATRGHLGGTRAGSAPATEMGRARSEVVSTSTAPTPPNGADPGTPWSPAAAASRDGTRSR
jgi:hypothetical protein